MKPRIEHSRVDPNAVKAMLGLQAYVNESGIEHSLLELVKLRASQVNGCAYCIDMHTEQRLYALDAWRETPFFSERERAALAWTEAVTNLGEGHVPDAVYDEARAQFGEAELVKLTMAVVAINGWNRLNVAFRTVPGTYRSALAAVETPKALAR